MLRAHAPRGIGQPTAAYSPGIEVSPGARWLYVSGQLGIDADGRVGEGVAEQTEIALRNLRGVLESAGMGVTDIVKITGFLTAPEQVREYQPVRDRFLGAHRPASTLVVVAALARPNLLVEVEAVAARTDGA